MISVILPTYNEAENIKKLIPEIKKEFPKAEIIVVDDNSPDKTADTARKLEVNVIERMKKEGLGAALIEGYNNAAGDIIVSMDADCSIDVKDIHKLLEKLENHDLVVGSKYSRGSKALGFSSKIQKILSFIGNRFFIIFFRLPVDDVTLNFRAFSKNTWKKLSLREKTNVFFLEMLIDAKHKKLKICQIPIVFAKRNYGKSKTNLKKLFPLYLKYLIKYILKR